MPEPKPKPTTVTREALYAQVWETPMQTLAASYGISGNGLAKICDKLKVPYPGRGYWAKIQSGKSGDRQPKLPAADSDTPRQWDIHPTLTPPAPELPGHVTDQIAKAEIAAAQAIERLAKPFRIRHPLVVKWKAETRDGHRAHPRLSGMRSEHEDTDVLGRRLRVLDALFVALEDAGAQIDQEKSSLHGFHVRIGQSMIEARLVERLKQVREPVDQKDRWLYGDRAWEQKLAGTGKLVLKIESYTDQPCKKEWIDKDNAPLENQLSAIVPAFAQIAHYVELREKRFAEERARSAEAQRRREEMARLQQLEKEKLEALLDLATKAEKADAIRRLVDKVALRAEGSEEFARWAEWARQKADDIDGVNVVLKKLEKRDQ